MPHWIRRTILNLGLELATKFFVFALQGAITLIVGALLALITLFTGYDHVHFFWGATLQPNKQFGVFVLAASLATLVVEAQLASRRLVRDSRDRIREQEDLGKLWKTQSFYAKMSL